MSSTGSPSYEVGNGLEVVRRVPANMWGKWSRERNDGEDADLKFSPEQNSSIGEMITFFSHEDRIRTGIVWWLNNNPQVLQKAMLQVLDTVHENKPANGKHSEAPKGQCTIIMVRDMALFSWILQQVLV